MRNGGGAMVRQVQLSTPFEVIRIRRFAAGPIAARGGTSRTVRRVRWTGSSGACRGDTPHFDRAAFPDARPGVAEPGIPRFRSRRPHS